MQYAAEPNHKKSWCRCAQGYTRIQNVGTEVRLLGFKSWSKKRLGIWLCIHQFWTVQITIIINGPHHKMLPQHPVHSKHSMTVSYQKYVYCCSYVTLKFCNMKIQLNYLTSVSILCEPSISFSVISYMVQIHSFRDIFLWDSHRICSEGTTHIRHKKELCQAKL